MSDDRDYRGEYWCAVRRHREVQIAFEAVSSPMPVLWAYQKVAVEGVRTLLKELEQNEQATREACEDWIRRTKPE